MKTAVVRSLRITVALIASIATGLGLAVAGPASPALAAERNPIVFVHGYWGDDWNWSVMVDRFRSAGWSDDELFVWDYNTAQSNVTTAHQLRDYIDDVLAQTGASKVDVVTHSMGGLSSRYYLKFLGGTAHVEAWVSLGGPNHGTTAAYLCWDPSCSEMRPGSAFLTELNAGDESPGDVRYGTVWSSCDEIINPDESTIISGATNHQTSGCVGHLGLLTSSEVFTLTRDFIH